MRRTFLSSGTPQTEDERWYVLQNWRQDAAVIIDEAAVQIERAHFSPYGRVFGMPAGDTNFDGAVTNTDTNLISAWSGLGHSYRAYADVDLDGDVDGDDASAANTTTMGWDVLSDVGSTVGYAGYVQDSFIPTLSHVRHRVYKSDLGRWIQRDPAGYVDGANLYEYVMGQPIEMRDWSGLASISVSDGSTGEQCCAGSVGDFAGAAVATPGCKQTIELWQMWLLGFEGTASEAACAMLGAGVSVCMVALIIGESEEWVRSATCRAVRPAKPPKPSPCPALRAAAIAACEVATPCTEYMTCRWLGLNRDFWMACATAMVAYKRAGCGNSVRRFTGKTATQESSRCWSIALEKGCDQGW